MMDAYGMSPQQRMAMALTRTAAAKGADTSATSSPWEGVNRGANAMLAAYLMNGPGRAPGNPDMMAVKGDAPLTKSGGGFLSGMFGGQPAPNPLAGMGGQPIDPSFGATPGQGHMTEVLDQPGIFESWARRLGYGG